MVLTLQHQTINTIETRIKYEAEQKERQLKLQKEREARQAFFSQVGSHPVQSHAGKQGIQHSEQHQIECRTSGQRD